MTEINPFDKQKRHVSPSQLAMYMRCGEQYRRRYLDGQKLPPGVALLRGSSLHKAAEMDFRHKRDRGEDLHRNDVVAIAVSEFDKRSANEEIHLGPDERARGRAIVLGEAKDSVAALAGTFRDEIAPKHAPHVVEQEQAIEIPGTNTDLVGRVDWIEPADGTIVDLKTRTRASAVGEHAKSPQFTTYALVRANVTGDPPPRIIVEELIDGQTPRTNTVVVPKKERADFVSLLESYAEMLKGIERGVFMPAYGQAGAWWCGARFCGYHGTCKYVPAHKRGKE